MNKYLAAWSITVTLIAGANVASATTLNGYFNDPLNSALVNYDLSPANFTDDNAIANNVALYTLTVPVSGTVSIVSTGFAAGGADPYFTLFTGSGNSATFLASNYDQAFATGGDFSYSDNLSAGQYEIALGTFANLSLAENYGSGTLSDGFAGLGEPGSLGTDFYALTVTAPVPEPPAYLLMLLGMFAVSMRMRTSASRAT